MEDDKEGDASSHSFAPLVSAGRTSSLSPRKRKPWPTALRLNFSHRTIRRTRQLLRWLMRRCVYTNKLLQVNRN
jgi:hypothetical protein